MTPYRVSLAETEMPNPLRAELLCSEIVLSPKSAVLRLAINGRNFEKAKKAKGVVPPSTNNEAPVALMTNS